MPLRAAARAGLGLTPDLLALPERVGDGVVVLRRMRPTDVEPFARAFADDPTLHVRIGLEAPPSPERVALERVGEDGARAAGSWARYVVAGADDAFAGCLTLLDLSTRHRRCELGLWLVAAARGRGWAPRALELGAGLAFGGDALDLERVVLHTEASNAGLRAAARRAGFAEEGLLRGHDREADGSRADIVVAGRLRR